MIANEWEEMQPIVDEYTGRNEWHDVFTITLGELVESGVFDWKRKELEWASAAYDDAQYSRVCDYFIRRYYWREISLVPVKKWFWMLQTKLVYELMPKYRPLYKRMAEGFNVLGIERETYDSDGRETYESTTSEESDAKTLDSGRAKSDDYGKSRDISSTYPETLLSGNSDYISDGNDSQHETVNESDYSKTVTTDGTKKGTSDYERNKADGYERVKEGETVERYNAYVELFKSVDTALLDELEEMFTCMYTFAVNGN